MNIGLMGRASRPRKMSLPGIILSFIVSIMLLLLLIFFLFEPHSGDYRISHSYSVDIDAADDEAYDVICPIPTTATGELRKGFSHDVRVLRGDATISVVTSEYGAALSIKGRGDVNISWTERWSGSVRNELADLSMFHWQGGSLSLNCWVYCDNEGVTIHLESKSSGLFVTEGTPRGHVTTRTIDAVLSPDGWQLANVVTLRYGLI